MMMDKHTLSSEKRHRERKKEKEEKKKERERTNKNYSLYVVAFWKKKEREE